jgi:hypothetical protein
MLAALSGSIVCCSFEDFGFHSWYCQNVITPLTDYITDTFEMSSDDLAAL